MTEKRFHLRVGFFRGLLGFALASISSGVLAQTPTPGPTPQLTPLPVKEDVVVSATRGSEMETEIPGEVTVITGAQLKERNVTNLADAIQDVVGLDTGMGSDNGPRQPNVGLWGLKEFDALLFMVDGVPIGGPFNPGLSQINVDDIDHIEIVKGPQGTLYGVSAFAGMVQVFTKSAAGGTSISLSGGSFSQGRVDASTVIPIGCGEAASLGRLRPLEWMAGPDRLQRRPRRSPPGRSAWQWRNVFGDLHYVPEYSVLRVTAARRSAERPHAPVFQIDRNYEPVGARLDHRVYSLTTNVSLPINASTQFENVFGVTRDDSISVQGFLADQDGPQASGPAFPFTRMRPTSTTMLTSP